MCGSPKYNQIQPSHKRKNSDKRKERSRDAARDRRAKETQLFQELESLLPMSGVPGNTQLSMDKTSLIRLTLANLKCRDLVEKGFVLPGVKEEGCIGGVMSTLDMLGSLDSFSIVLSEEMEVIYISNNVESHIGLNALELMGEPFCDYIHPCDHHQLKTLLTLQDGETKEAYVRIKVTVTERGRMINLRQANYKVLKISGIVRKVQDCDNGGLAGNVFLGLAQLISRDTIAQNVANFPLSGVFQTKHSSDMKFVETDLWLSTVGQYPSGYLEGKSFYEFVHVEDSPKVQKGFKNLCEQGQCETAPYRFLVARGGWVWIQTRANLTQVRKGSSKGNTIICIHTAISEVMNREDVLALVQIIQETKNIRKKQKIENVEPFQKITFMTEPKPFDDIYNILQVPDAKVYDEASNVLQILDDQPGMLPVSFQNENYASFSNTNFMDQPNFYPAYPTPSVIVEPKKSEPQVSTESLFGRSTVIVSPKSTIPISATVTSPVESPNVVTSDIFASENGLDFETILSEENIQDNHENIDIEIDDGGIFSLPRNSSFEELCLDGCYDLEELSPSSSDIVKIEENNQEQIPVLDFCDESFQEKQKNKEGEKLVDNSEEFFKILGETMPPKTVNYRPKEDGKTLFVKEDTKILWGNRKSNTELETYFSNFNNEINMPSAEPLLVYNPCLAKMNTVKQTWNTVVENTVTESPINHPKMWKNTEEQKPINPLKMWDNATENMWKRKRSPDPEYAYSAKNTMSAVSPDFPVLQKFLGGQNRKNGIQNPYDNIINSPSMEIPKKSRPVPYNDIIKTNPKRITPIHYYKNLMENPKQLTTAYYDKIAETNSMEIQKRLTTTNYDRFVETNRVQIPKQMEYDVNLDPRNMFLFSNN